MPSNNTYKIAIELVKQMYISVLVLTSCVCLVCSQGTRSPCPGIFDYERDGSGIRGKIVLTPGEPTSRLVVQANFTVPARILSNDYGSLDLVDHFALQKYNQGSPMVFRVRFPIISPLPKLTAITANGQLLCNGSGDTLRPNQYLTTFSLGHSTYFQVQTQIDQTQSQDLIYDMNPIIYPVHQPSIPAYEPTRRPNPNLENQNVYYPSYEESTQIPYNSQTPKQPRPAPQKIPQYYPPEEEVNPTPEIVTTERVVQKPQPQPQCGTRSSEVETVALIYGGEEYQRGDQPWLVAIYKKNDKNLNFKCGGTLVSNKHVITAAHCMWIRTEKSSKKDMVVKLGVHRLSDWEDDIVVTRSVIAAITHEEYDSRSLKNDLLVLVLNKQVKFNKYIRPACFWDGNNNLEQIVGDFGVVSGWGEQSERQGIADIPNLVRMPIVTTKNCRSSKESFVHHTSENTFCAGSRNGTGPCRGDSGSGMYLLNGSRWFLRGVVSVSFRNSAGGCNLNEYIIFTDTAKYLPWIKKVLAMKNFSINDN